jgi:hypothetical protein
VSQGEPLANLWSTFFPIPITTTNPLVIFLHGWRALFLPRNATFLKKCCGFGLCWPQSGSPQSGSDSTVSAQSEEGGQNQK